MLGSSSIEKPIRREDARLKLFDSDKSANQLPVCVITGFLGSGKTTLLNRLLRHPDMSDSAVIINEWGEVGIDHLLVEGSTARSP
jgi:Flp pilus assembly CpaF family ATPase